MLKLLRKSQEPKQKNEQSTKRQFTEEENFKDSLNKSCLNPLLFKELQIEKTQWLYTH